MCACTFLKSVILFLFEYFFIKSIVLCYISSRVSYRVKTKSSEKVLINCVRMEQRKGDKSAAAAEKKLLVRLWLQESRAPLWETYVFNVYDHWKSVGGVGGCTRAGVAVREQYKNTQ